VIRKVGVDNYIVAATPEKIHSLGEISLWVDTGDRKLDGEMEGYCRVITGRGEEIVCRVTAG
jgi:predicted polyphosphate/ATP-dependent NAD kinase